MLPIAMDFSTRPVQERTSREMVLDGREMERKICARTEGRRRFYAGACALFHIGLKVELELWSLHQFFSVSNFGGTEFLCKN
jgi:hypothetical protein